jgi:preprotein translocase subunit SecD
MRSFIASALLVIATPALAQAEAQTLYIGTEAFRHADIVDARALPDIDGGVSISLTVTEAASKRLASVTHAHVNKPLKLRVGDTVLAIPIVREPLLGGTVQITVDKTLDDATMLAKFISGKDPLPDSLEGE